MRDAIGPGATFVMLALLLAEGATRAEEVAPEPPAARPRIGVALSGGGARGGAHVGVLQVLEELHVPVDAVAGTSMGALIGGLYAAGVPIDRLERVLRGADWGDLLDDRPPYRELVYRRKEDAARYLVDFELGFRKGKLRQPRGLRAGQKLAFEARVLLLDTPREPDFSKLPVPFCATATDVETGDRVILDHGDLVESILASVAVPGVFAPVAIDGRLLVDGGIVDNLPVDLVRGEGADVVIAVDVGTPLASREKLGSMFAVLGQTLTFLTRKNSDASLADADLVVTPDLTGISSGDFESTPQAITRGREAALAARAALSRYSLDDAAWAEYVARRSRPAPAEHRIGAIRVEGNQEVDSRLILAHMHVKPGDLLDAAALRKDMERIYGLDYFQRVTVDVVPESGGDTLVLHVEEKTWGPTYMRFGLEVVDDLEGDARYAVRTSITRTLINRYGLEWRNDLQLGSTQIVRSELYQPLDFAGRFFISPWIQGQRETQPVFVDGARVADYDIRSAGVGIDLGTQFGSLGEIRLGVNTAKVHTDVETGAPTLPSVDVDAGGVSFRVALSTLDRPTIATHGGEFRGGVDFSRTALGADANYERAFAGGSYFFGRGRHTGFVVADAGSNLGSTLPVYDQFTIGGLFSLGGYSEGEFRGQYFATAKLGYHYRIASLPAGFGQGVYVAGLLEGGNVWDTSADISASNLRYSFTAIVGADTIIGPMLFAYAVAEGGSNRLYLTVGRTF
jgi:NTE family protein